MDNLKKLIKIYFISSLVTLVLGYFFYVNSELKLIILNSPYVSNSLLFDVFIGLFSGSFVGLVIEISNYFKIKRNVIESCYHNAVNVYALLAFQNKIIESYLEDKTKVIPENVFSIEAINLMNNLIMQIKLINYSPFCKKDKYNTIISELDKILPSINSAIANFNFIKIAVLKQKISNLEISFQKDIVTANDKSVFETLNKVKAEIDNCLNDLEKVCSDFYKANKNYNWNNDKKYIEKNSKLNTYKLDLEEYLNN